MEKGTAEKQISGTLKKTSLLKGVMSEWALFQQSLCSLSEVGVFHSGV